MVSALVLLVALSACVSQSALEPAPAMSPDDARRYIDHSLPSRLTDRAGWADDIYQGLSLQGVDPSRESICAVVAVIGQESGFQVNPVVPGLPAIAWAEIDRRAQRAGVPSMLVHAALKLPSSSGKSYAARIDAARTEKDLSDIFEDFVKAVPLGEQLFGDRNPIRTRGPMQVSVAFAKEQAAAKPYPYPLKHSVAEELFTRRGSIYYGISHLFGYAPPYDDYLYRFADFNAGQYASRNAAFQAALGKVAHVHVAADGALLPHDGADSTPGTTERAARTLASRIDLRDSDVHRALELSKTREFERSALYVRVFELADQAAAKPLPRALIPSIELHGPKISHRLTTDWYAHRVDTRFKQCLAKP